MKNSEYIFLMPKKTDQYIFITKVMFLRNKLDCSIRIDLLKVLTVYCLLFIREELFIGFLIIQQDKKNILGKIIDSIFGMFCFDKQVVTLNSFILNKAVTHCENIDLVRINYWEAMSLCREVFDRIFPNIEDYFDQLFVCKFEELNKIKNTNKEIIQDSEVRVYVGYFDKVFIWRRYTARCI